MTSPLSQQKETYDTLWRVNSLTRLIFFFFLLGFSCFFFLCSFILKSVVIYFSQSSIGQLRIGKSLLRPLRYILVNIKQVHGFKALQDNTMNPAMNLSTVSNAQMGGSSQSQRNIRVNI